MSTFTKLLGEARMDRPAECSDSRGHIWLEADESVMNRRKAKPGTKAEIVTVHCRHCGATAELSGYGPKR